ncbi:unnamed protein product [Medioppia subpectinata]|uniref:Uncharacterized protein n=1 Tax=Medioppia subpectinata TaxID=1979941 RepID=A0A7R9KE11_9ACAR|nr:unnamed protein product [Medioppia subpectinata]CAG2101819.1 unnamed protein product [Medioppia subpectinata]
MNCARVDVFSVNVSIKSTPELDITCYYEMEDNEDFKGLTIKLNGTSVYTWDQRSGKKPELNNALRLNMVTQPQPGPSKSLIRVWMDDNHEIRTEKIGDKTPNTGAFTKQGVSTIAMTLFIILINKVLSM